MDKHDLVWRLIDGIMVITSLTIKYGYGLTLNVNLANLMLSLMVHLMVDGG